jgi:hypothetical protein
LVDEDLLENRDVAANAAQLGDIATGRNRSMQMLCARDYPRAVRRWVGEAVQIDAIPQVEVVWWEVVPVDAKLGSIDRIMTRRVVDHEARAICDRIEQNAAAPVRMVGNDQMRSIGWRCLIPQSLLGRVGCKRREHRNSPAK